MKKTTKKLLALMCACAAATCLSVGGVVAFSQATTVQAVAETLEVDFTNNGKFSITQYGSNTLEYVNATDLGTGEGSVLKVNASAGSAYVTVDFSAGNIKAADVESIVVRIYSPGFKAGSDSFRSSNPDTSAGWLMNTSAYDMSSWCDVTLSAAVITYMTDVNGYLTKPVFFGARVNSGASAYYIDSITVNMKEVEAPKETTKVSFSTIHGTWNNNPLGSLNCTFLQFNGGISGNGDMDADFSDLISKMTINGESVDANNVLFRCPNWIGASGGIIMCITTNPEVGSVLCLPAGATFNIGGTDTNVYEIANDTYLQFDGAVWTVCDKPVETNYNPNFVSVGSINHYDNEALGAYGLSLIYDTTGFTTAGNQIMPSAATGFTLNGDAVTPALWGGEQLLFWLAKDKCADDYNGYSHATLVIENGATITNESGKTFTLGGATLYLVNGAWTTTKPDGYNVQMANASFVDFSITGIATQNHVHNGSFYQVTLDFDGAALALNQHAAAVSGLTFNGVPMTCGGAPSGDSIMVITLNNGLWIHYTDAQAASGYKNYSHATIHFEEGATVTDVNGATVTYAELTLYLVDGAWTTTKPENYGIIDTTNYTPDFVSIGELNHVYSEGLNAYGVSLIYDTTGFETEGAYTATNVSGFSLNGESFTPALMGANQVLLWLAADKCAEGYKGYSHPTIVIEEGAKLTNSTGKEFTLGGATLYLVDGAWTTVRPDGYQVEIPPASFTDFQISGIGSQNHVHNGSFYQLTLDFDGGELAMNQHASAVSGITFNGIPMTCGGAPKNDSIMVITLGVGLWIHYTDAQAAAGYKNYSHATIHFEDGATVTDVNGETITYAEVTLYLVDGAWTTEQPADYKITVPAKDTTFIALGNTEETNSANILTLYFNDENEWTDDIGTLADKVILGDVSLTSIGGSITKSERSLTIAWTGEYTTLTIDQGATFAGQNIPQMTLYLNNGVWSFIDGSKEATVSCSGPASGAWDNVEYKEGYSSNVFKFSADFATEVDTTNQAASVAYPVATGIKINGVSLYELYLQDNKTTVNYEHGYKYLYIMVAKEYLEAAEGEYTYLTIEKGTTFMGQVLPACRYILYEGHWLNAESFDPTPLQYNGIAPGWNNLLGSGVSNNILQFGEYGVNFLGPDNGTVNHADANNLANPALKAPIATAMTIDGKTMAELYELDNRVQVTYAHGYNYFHFAIPEYMLSKEGYGCVTLHIEGGTIFMGCVLSEVTLYLYEGEWTNIKPDIVESEDTDYTTITDLFGEETKTLSGTVSAESTLTASDSVIYSFLLKNDSIDNTVMFSTHYTTEFDGIKVVFIGDALTGNERVLLFVNGQEVGNASYLWTENEWFAVRIAVDVAETLSVSVAIDGVYVVKATGLSKDALGTKVGVQNEQGNNAFADYKAGDIKKPILYWQGKDVYRYEVNAEKPADSVFQAVIDVMDNKDGVVDESTVQVLWQEGAVTDGKLNEGTWVVTLSVSDAAGNIAQHTITVVVEDTNRVTVTFDGVETDTIYHIGESLAEPETPVKEGYTFEGWYVGNVKWDFANDVVKGDVALTAKFIKVETTYTVVITSEGLEENYVYTFEFANGATLDQSVLVRDGYTYKLYVGDTEVQAITVDSDANYKVVYTKVQDKPITPPDDSSSDSSDESSSGNNSSSDSQDNVGGSSSSDKKGCFGTVSFGGVGVTLLLATAVKMMKKRKED